MIDRLTGHRFGVVILVALLVAVNAAGSLLRFRIDLTGEGRYTLSDATRRLVEEMPGEVVVTVLLDGEMPAGFRRLRGGVEDLLSALRDIAPGKLRYSYMRPGEGLADTARLALYDSLQRMGIQPTNVKAQTKQGEGTEETLVFPAAVVEHGGRAVGVDLLRGLPAGGLDALNRAEALLEYNLADAIRRVTRENPPRVAYLAGNGEPLDYRVYDLIEDVLRSRYAFAILPIDSVGVIPRDFDAVCIVKPSLPFTEAQKLKIDQYVMQGGSVFWMIDNLYASLDSLQRSEGSFIAFDTGLALEDLLFRYGVRINRDLVQDLRNDGIPSVIGNVGGKPQIQVLPWPYFPLLAHPGDHPIARNLDYVLAQFPQSVDTVAAPNIRKTVLLSSSGSARILQTPARVEWRSIRNEEELRTFDRRAIPVAMLLEGRFRSLYANRLSRAAADSLSEVYGQAFLAESAREARMVVVADGDLALNPVSQEDGPLSMGMNAYTRRQYANKSFVTNVLEHLTDDSGILSTRSKEYVLRLLDPQKLESGRLRWQVLNIALPLLLVAATAYLLSALRRRRFARVEGRAG